MTSRDWERVIREGKLDGGGLSTSYRRPPLRDGFSWDLIRGIHVWTVYFGPMSSDPSSRPCFFGTYGRKVLFRN